MLLRFYGYWGFKASGSESIAAAGETGSVLAATAVLFLILAGIANFTILVLKKIENRCITSSYSFMLAMALIIFAGISMGGKETRE